MLVSTANVFAAKKLPPTSDEPSPHSHPTITFTMKVVNATVSGSPVEGDKAFVAIYHGNKQTAVMVALVDSSGMAVFKDIPGGGHFQAVPRAEHSEMMFGGQPVSLESPNNEVSCTVEVYDVGFDNSVIAVGTHHLTVKSVGQSLMVTEFMQLLNTTDKAVSSNNMNKNDKPKVIEISLPKGFSDLKFSQYFDKNAVVVTEDGFHDTMAIPPGSHEASFAYKIDMDRLVMNVQKKFSLPTKDFMVFSQLEQMTQEGLGQPQGTFNMPDGTEAKYYASTSYKAGDELVFQIKSIKADKPYNKIVISIAIGALIIFLVLIIKKLALSKP